MLLQKVEFKMGQWEILGQFMIAVRWCPWVIVISKRRIGWGKACVI